MKVNVYNQQGEEAGTTLLPKEIFGLELNLDLIHQVAVSQMANRRQTLANTKDRGEVSGGGRKPWQQKGLGRARHGSIRSPIWRKGGTVFGPQKEKVFKKKIPQKMKRAALFMVLSDKAKNNLLIILDRLNLEKAKTRLMAEIFKNLRLKILQSSEGSILLALPEIDKNIILAARNLPEARTMGARDLNCLDLLSFKYLVMPKDAIKVIKETFIKDNK